MVYPTQLRSTLGSFLDLYPRQHCQYLRFHRSLKYSLTQAPKQMKSFIMTFLRSDRPRCRPQLSPRLGQHRVRVHLALWLLAVTTVVISDSSFVLHPPHEVCYLQRNYSVQAVFPFIRLPVFDKVC